jgi:hypothetical protein
MALQKYNYTNKIVPSDTSYGNKVFNIKTTAYIEPFNEQPTRIDDREEDLIHVGVEIETKINGKYVKELVDEIKKDNMGKIISVIINHKGKNIEVPISNLRIVKNEDGKEIMNINVTSESFMTFREFFEKNF